MRSNIIFPSINSFEEYEKFKLNIDALEKAAHKVIQLHHLPNEPLELFVDGTNIVFAYGKHRVIKIFPPIHQDHCKTELMVLHHLQNKLSVKTPRIEYEGEIAGWPYMIMSRLEGTLLETLWEEMDQHNKIIIMHELGALVREVHALPTHGLEAIDCHWQKFIEKQISECVEHQRTKNFPETLLKEIPEYLESIKESLLQIKKPVLLTGEYTPMNLLVKQRAGIWHINGLIDFGDCMLGRAEYDLLGPGAFLIQGDKQLLKEFLTSYGYARENLTSTLSQQLTALMLLHRYSNLDVQIRIKNWKNKVNNLQELGNLIWGISISVII